MSHKTNCWPFVQCDMQDNQIDSFLKQTIMQQFHVERARTLLENAEEIFDAGEVRQAVEDVAAKLNEIGRAHV